MPSLPDTRRSLFLRLTERSPGAWDEFIAIYERAILALCRRRGLQEADARDALQVVLLAVDERVATWDHTRAPGGFRSWLLRVARNATVDEIRRRQRQPAAIDAMGIDASGAADPHSGFDEEYRSATFAWACEQVRSVVRDEAWASFWMTAVQRVPPERVAEDLGLSVGAVYTAKCRVARRLREAVASAESPDPRDAETRDGVPGDI
ncbi:MAG: sigma-70 family RNA polymerase sigma factor [Planctomycetota bacterium]